MGLFLYQNSMNFQKKFKCPTYGEDPVFLQFLNKDQITMVKDFREREGIVEDSKTLLFDQEKKSRNFFFTDQGNKHFFDSQKQYLEQIIINPLLIKDIFQQKRGFEVFKVELGLKNDLLNEETLLQITDEQFDFKIQAVTDGFVVLLNGQ